MSTNITRYVIPSDVDKKPLVTATVFPRGGGKLTSRLRNGYATAREADILESFLLAMACEGIDIGSSAIAQALTTTLETLAQ